MFNRTDQMNDLIDLLRSTNGTISYAAIEKKTGALRPALYSLLTRARRYLERDEGIVFDTERGTGLRRMTDTEKVASLTGFERKIHRTAGYGQQRTETVHDASALSNEDQLQLTISRTVFETVRRNTHQERN